MLKTTLIPMFHKFSDNLLHLTWLLGLSTFGIAFFSFAWLGLFSRYYADDLCMSGLIVKLGFWPAQVFQYTTWSNRFAGMFTLALSDFLGLYFIRFWTLIVLVFWLLILAWAIDRIVHFCKLSLSKGTIFLLAQVTIFFTLMLSPQVYQNLFWRIGIITYSLPLILLSLMIGIVFDRAARFVPKKLPYFGMAALALLTFFAGGLSETYAVLQGTILALAWFAVWLFAKGDFHKLWLALLSAGLGGAFLSLLVVLLAPGNAARRAFMPPPPDLLTWLKMTGANTFIFLFGSLSANAFQMLLAFSIALLLVYLYFHRKKLPNWRPTQLIFAFIAGTALTVILTMAIMAPVAYAQSSYPDGRVLIHAAWLLTVMLVWQGVLVGILLAKLHQWAEDPLPLFLQSILVISLAGLLLYPLYPAYQNHRKIPEFKQQALTWDDRDTLIRQMKASGQDNLSIGGMNAPGDMPELTYDQQNWVNVCAAQFYDVQTIVVEEP